MRHYIIPDNELSGGVSPIPTLPNNISLDLQRPLKDLFMYTNNLQELCAPAELCVQKALELIEYRNDYELNLATFRMELLAQNAGSDGVDEVNLLIIGIECLCKYLMVTFDNYAQSSADFFPYEFYSLHLNRYLILTKITLDAKLDAIRPATIVKPAYTYPEMQTRTRTDYFTEANQPIIIQSDFPTALRVLETDQLLR